MQLCLPAFHLVSPKWISKIKHADVWKWHITIRELGSIHDQGLRSVSDIIHIYHNILISSKLPQQVFHKWFNIKSSSKISSFEWIYQLWTVETKETTLSKWQRYLTSRKLLMSTHLLVFILVIREEMGIILNNTGSYYLLAKRVDSYNVEIST